MRDKVFISHATPDDNGVIKSDDGTIKPNEAIEEIVLKFLTINEGTNTALYVRTGLRMKKKRVLQSSNTKNQLKV